jgi:ABC-type Na+ transport system ATPase subunit NatA
LDRRKLDGIKSSAWWAGWREQTTTIRMLAGIMDPSSGNATIAGFNLRKQAEN